MKEIRIRISDMEYSSLIDCVERHNRSARNHTDINGYIEMLIREASKKEEKK